jgi:hypothetical protein
MPRKSVPSSNGNTSRTQAATEIVRLEYERERLTLAVTNYRARLATTSETLQNVERRIQWLMERNTLAR